MLSRDGWDHTSPKVMWKHISYILPTEGGYLLSGLDLVSTPQNLGFDLVSIHSTLQYTINFP